MNNILILDTETTGLNVNNDNVIEIGCIFYNFLSKTIIHQSSTLLKCYHNKAEHINNISIKSMENIIPQNETSFLYCISQMIEKCSLIIAHNAIFDKKFIEKTFKNDLSNKKWICSKKDIKWPFIGSLSLNNISKNMGVINNNAHRALGDCQTLLSCLLKLNNFDEQIMKLYEN